MPVEFLGFGATHDGSETHPRSGPVFDKNYTLRVARAHEEHGWDRILLAYGADTPDPAQVAAFVSEKLDRLQVLLAHRPNVSYPTFAAKTFATLDQISSGRLTVHFITGSNDHEQQREGDYLTKDERYARTREYIQVVKRAWTSREAFDFTGEHYRFVDFVSDVFPVQRPRPPVSFAGSSPAAYTAGGAEADIYCLWGEPLARTAEQIASIKAAAKAAGRTDIPRIQVGFRIIIGPTEELAWAKAYRTLGAIMDRTDGGTKPLTRRHSLHKPENAGSQRLLAVAAEGELFDRALWTPIASTLGGTGNSTALVGTPETIAAALLDYYDLGVEILCARGYDMIDDTIDFGRYVIPIVRDEVAKRDAERTTRSARAMAPLPEPRRDVAPLNTTPGSS